MKFDDEKNFALGGTDKQKGLRMTELARTFPALKGKTGPGAVGIDPWDIVALSEASRPWSSGEKLVVSFLCSVWDSAGAAEFAAPFDVIEACKRWDASNWAAFSNWASDPFYC